MKKLLSVAVVLSMICSLSASAFAAQEHIIANGQDVTGTNNGIIYDGSFEADVPDTQALNATGGISADDDSKGGTTLDFEGSSAVSGSIGEVADHITTVNAGVTGTQVTVTGGLYADALNITGNGEIELDAASTVTTTTFTGAGTLDLDATLTGAIDYRGAGTVTLADNCNITGAITTNANNQGTLTIAGASTFASAIGTSTSLDLATITKAGVGVAAFNGAVYADAVTITQSGGTTFGSTVNAATLIITDTTDAATVSFADNLTLTTGMTVSNAGSDLYNVSITGTTNSIAGTTTFANGGTVTIGDASGDSTTFVGGVTVTGPSALNIAGTVTTEDANSTFSSPVVLTANAAISTAKGDGEGTGDITFNSALNGTAGTETLTLTAEKGDILFSGAVGSPYGVYGNAVSYWSFNESSGFTANDPINSNDGNLNGYGGTPGWTTGKVEGALNFDGSNDYVNVASSDSYKPASNITITAWVYPETYPSGWSKIVCLDYRGDGTWNLPYLSYAVERYDVFSRLGFEWTVGGVLHQMDSGLTWNDGAWNFVAVTLDGTTVRTYVNGVAGNTRDQDGNIDYGTSKDLAMGGSSSYYFPAPPNNEKWDGSIDEVGIWALALSPSEIAALYNNNNGYTHTVSSLGAITINSAANVTFSSTVQAASFTQFAGTGTTKFDGAVTFSSGATQLFINTVTIDINGNIITTPTAASGTAKVDLNATTLVDLATGMSITTTAAANTGYASGAIDIDVSGTGTVNLAGNLVTTGAANNTAATAASAGGEVTIDTNNGVIAVNAITTSGGASTGAGAANGGTAGAITLNTGTNNVITLNGNLSAIGGASTNATGGDGGAVTISDPASLATGAIRIDTSGGDGVGLFDGVGGKIDFQGTLNSTTAQTLTLDTAGGGGDGDIDFDGVVGGTAALGAVTIDDAKDVTASAAFSAASLVQTAGSGTTTLMGDVTTTAAAGVDITNTNIILDGLTIDTSAGDGVARFNGATVLNDDTTITRGAGAVTFTGAVNSQATETNDLAIDGATGANITFTGAVGSGVTQELGAILVSTAATTWFGSTVEATSLHQDAGTTTTLTDNVTTTGAAGVDITATNITLDGLTIDTSAGNGAARFNGAVTLATAAVTVTSGTGNINFTGTVDNGGLLLTINNTGASTGTITGAISNTGGLTKEGTGTLTLSGSNTYSGATNINGGTVQISAADGLGDGSGTNTIGINGGTLRSTAGTYALAANQVITLNGAGTIQTDANTLTLAQNIINGANLLTVTGDGNTTINGIIGAGAGGVTKAGAGMLTLGGANTYTGATTVNAGTLQAGVATTAFGVNSAVTMANAAGAILDLNDFNQTIGSLNGGGALGGNVDLGAGTLTTGALNTADTYDGVISGTGGLTKAGTGTLTLSGANTYSGATLINVNCGTVRVSNSSALGTGAGGVTNNATLDIGSTTLNIGGTYTQGATSTLMVVVNGTSSGSIVATGAAAAAAGYNVTLNVSNYVPNNTTYTIIDGATGVGTIGTPTITVIGSNQATFSVTAIGDDLILTASRTANGFASSAKAGDSNASAIGTVLDTITNPSDDMTTVLNTMAGLSSSQVASALDAMVPEVDAGVINTSTTVLNNFVGVAMDRIENIIKLIRNPHDSAKTGFSAGEAGKISGIWGKGYGSYLTQDMRKGIAGYDAWNAGTALGADHLFADCVTLGVSGGYAYGNVDSDVNNANTCINSAQTTVYGGYLDSNLPYFIDAAGAFAYNWYNGQRDINVGPTLSRTAKAKYGGQQYSVYLGGGYEFDVTKNIEFTPLVSLQWNHLRLNKYTETEAGALSLSVASQNYDQLQSGLGARIASPMKFAWGTFTLEAHGKWFYDFIGDSFTVTSNFNGGGASFNSNGAKPACNSFNAGGKLVFDFKNNISIVGDCDTEMKDQFFGIYGSLTVRYDF